MTLLVQRTAAGAASLLLLSFAARGEPPDGGIGYYANSDAGVYQVASAALPSDGGTLGSGWWLSSQRMTAVGGEVVGLRNELKSCEHARDEALTVVEQPSNFRSFIYGVAVGIVAGGASIFAVARAMK